MAGAVIVLFAGWLTFSGSRGSRKENSPNSQKNSMIERITLTTKDNISLVGDYSAPDASSERGLLLLHMMPATRTSWAGFAQKARRTGFHVLAIDLYGHGESEGGPDGYKTFSDANHQRSKNDVQAAAEFLKSKGVAKLYLGGASIGANLALQHLAENPETSGAFLLSPGLDYRGIQTESSARGLKPEQRVLYAASRDDQYSFESVERLAALRFAGHDVSLRLFETAGHGTTMFEREPRLMDEIVEWLAAKK